MRLFSLFKKFLLGAACLAMFGAATPAFSNVPLQVQSYRDFFMGTAQPTKMYLNEGVAPLILDAIQIQSSTGDPIYLVVSSSGFSNDGGIAIVGNYAFLMTGQWSSASPVGGGVLAPTTGRATEFLTGTTYYNTTSTAIVILPGDSFRFFTPAGATFCVSISGHWNYSPFIY